MEHETNSITHQLVRLTDAQGVVSWMLFTEERKIVRSVDSGVHSDEINIKLRALGSFQKNVRENVREAEKNVMEMRGRAFSMSDGTVNFSNGYIVVEDPWKEMRIGTFMMNHLVAWAITHYPGFQPVGIRLSSPQGYDGNKERRNRFYDRFGFRFIWDDALHLEGSLDPELRVSDLRTTDKWEERIKVFAVDEGMELIFSESQQLRMDRLDAQYRAQTAIEARNRAEADAEQARAGRARWGLAGLALGVILGFALNSWWQ